MAMRRPALAMALFARVASINDRAVWSAALVAAREAEAWAIDPRHALYRTKGAGACGDGEINC